MIILNVSPPFPSIWIVTTPKTKALLSQLSPERNQVRSLWWMNRSFLATYFQFLRTRLNDVWPAFVMVEDGFSNDQFSHLCLNCVLYSMSFCQSRVKTIIWPDWKGLWCMHDTLPIFKYCRAKYFATIGAAT